MGLSEEEQKKIHEQKLQPKGTNTENSEKGQPVGIIDADKKGGESCCRGANGFSCCRDETIEEVGGDSGNVASGFEKSGVREQGVCSSKGFCGLSSWLETWDRADTLAAVSVVGAVATVAVAYSFYRRSG